MNNYKKSSWMLTESESLDPKLSQKVFTSQNAMVVYYIYEAGLEFPEHSHPQEQVTIIQNGNLLLKIAGENVELKKGDICSISPNVVHSSVVLGEENVE